MIASSFDWFTVLSESFVIGLSDYFGFGFETLDQKPLEAKIEPIELVRYT